MCMYVWCGGMCESGLCVCVSRGVWRGCIVYMCGVYVCGLWFMCMCLGCSVYVCVFGGGVWCTCVCHSEVDVRQNTVFGDRNSLKPELTGSARLARETPRSTSSNSQMGVVTPRFHMGAGYWIRVLMLVSEAPCTANLSQLLPCCF